MPPDAEAIRADVADAVEADAVERDAGEADAVRAGLDALRYRDLSERELEQKLAARGFTEDECEGAVATLRRTGVLDERRFAENRARSLASRGAGDGLIRYELARAGVASELAQEAIDTLEPETARARTIILRRGASAKTARHLLAKGFSADAVAGAVASTTDEELG